MSANPNASAPASATARSPDGTARLRAIMARLRDPERGCPWDLVQDFESIAPYTIEEAYEVADAIARRDMDDLRDELGDLLLQVVYHAQMAEEAGYFNFDDVAAAVGDKMVRRHPHVFGGADQNRTPGTQTREWERIKAAERAGRSTRSGALDGVAAGLPALVRAVKLQARAARVGFDWPNTAAVTEKIVEEARELAEAGAAGGQQTQVVEEFGDLMFVMANLARHLEIDPESALRGANAKFVRRFSIVEAELARRGLRPEDSTLREMDDLWNAAKQAERQP